MVFLGASDAENTSTLSDNISDDGEDALLTKWAQGSLTSWV